MMRGTFVRSRRLAGATNLMMRMISDPGFVHRVAAMALEYNLAKLEMPAAAGADVLIVEDDIATTHTTLISTGISASSSRPATAASSSAPTPSECG